MRSAGAVLRKHALVCAARQLHAVATGTKLQTSKREKTLLRCRVTSCDDQARVQQSLGYAPGFLKAVTSVFK